MIGAGIHVGAIMAMIPAHKGQGTMLEFDRQQRAFVADKVTDMANLVAGAIAIGFVIGDQPTSLLVFAAGLVTWLMVLLVAVLINGGKP